MPELPEVETVVRTLEYRIKGRRITDVDIRMPKIIEGDPEVFAETLKGQSFREFGRRGKYLLFYMDDCVLVSHLRMEGKYYIQKPDEPFDRHVHVIFRLDDGTELRYHDTRQFGRMSVVSKDQDFSGWHSLGPEPFDDRLTAEYIYRTAKYRNTPLKTLLLDQSFIAGIGNIYADEILASCHLRPGRNCRRITRADAENIRVNTVRIMREAIACGGTTIRSYTSSLGVTGMFQTECTVHMQKICPVCGSEIKVKRIGGRSSYYCPACQK